MTKSVLFLLFLSFSISAFCNDIENDKIKKETPSSSSIQFIENKNQWHKNILFSVRLHEGAIFFEKNCLTFVLANGTQLEKYKEAKNDLTIIPPRYVDAAAYRVHFVGANPEPVTKGDGEYPFYHNYYLGNSPANWASRVKVFDNIYYSDIYNGIDLRYYQHDSHLKYDFIISPGSDPRMIELEYEGVKSLSISNYNLVINTAIGSFLELKPYAYQLLPNGEKVEISCAYKVSKNKVTFELGDYKAMLPLIIDPVLVFSTYSGSTADNWGFTATYDSYGNTYGGGIVFDFGYPTTLGAYQIDYAGGEIDIAISKFNPAGTNLLFSTYLGGASVELPSSLVVNENDELYVLGVTSSANFPVTSNAFQTVFKGGADTRTTSAIDFSGADMVISKFNSTGTQLLASTFVGGTGNDGLNRASVLVKNYADDARGEIIVDDQSNVYVISSTSSVNFPVTANAFQTTYGGGEQDACIIKMNHNLSNMIWASYLGGSKSDAGYSIDIGKDRSIYVCGGTNSANFPITSNTLQPTLGSSADEMPDGFVAHINEFGTQLLHSTFLGDAGYDQTYLLKTDRNGSPYVFGQTYAQGNFWIRNAAWNKPGGGQFVTKLHPNLNSIVWSTAFGRGYGSPDISPTAFLVDVCNNVYMAGWGGTLNDFGGTSGLPITSDAIQNTTDGNDYYLICISENASSLVYATFFGSPTRSDHVDGGTSRFDKKGTIYQAVCAGCSRANDFPTTPGVWSDTNRSNNCNLGVMKLDFELSAIIADFIMPNTVCAPATIDFDNISQTLSTSTFFWDFGDGSTSTLQYPSHEYTTFGNYTVTLVVRDPGSCNGTDTMTKQIVVLANTLDTLSTIYVCDLAPVQIGLPPGQDTALTYHWEPTTGLSNPDISNPIANITESTIYTLYISNGSCFDTLVHVIEYVNVDFSLEENFIICLGDSVLLHPTINSEASYYIWSTSPTFDPIINEDQTVADIYVAPTTTTTYYFKVGNGICFSTASTTVRVSDINLTLPDTLRICLGEQITITPQFNCDQCSFVWDSLPSIISGNGTSTITVAPSSNTSYILTLTDIAGCSLKDTTVIIVFEDLFTLGMEAWTDDNSIIQGDTAHLHCTFYSGNFTYQWTPSESVLMPNSHNTPARPAISTIYHATITDINGCKKSDTVHIFVEELLCKDPYVFVPNAFTPNNDNVNDVLYVRSNIVDWVLFRIYNRWGEKVFESTRLEDGWDGTWKGVDAPAGVYDYSLEVRCLGGRTHSTKGNVTLIR